MKKGNNRNTPTPYSTVAAPAHGKRRPGATARDGGGRAARARAGNGAAAGGGAGRQAGQPGV